MSELKKLFEKMYIKNAPSWSIEQDEDGSYKYHATKSAFTLFEIQQAKIDELKNIIKMQECGVEAIKQTLNEIYNACDEDETVSMLLDKIQELLK